MARQRVEAKLDAGYQPARVIIRCPTCAHEVDIYGAKAHAQDASDASFDYDCRCGEVMTVVEANEGVAATPIPALVVAMPQIDELATDIEPASETPPPSDIEPDTFE